MLKLFCFLLLTTAVYSETEKDCEKIQIEKCPTVLAEAEFNKDVQEAFKVGYETFVMMKHSLELTTTLNVINGEQIFYISPLSSLTESFQTNSARNFTLQMRSVVEIAANLYKNFQVINQCATAMTDNVFDKLDCIAKVLASADALEKEDIEDRFRITTPSFNETIQHRLRMNNRFDEYRKGQEILRRFGKIGKNMLIRRDKEKGLSTWNIVDFMRDVSKEMLNIVKGPFHWIHTFRGSDAIDEVIRTMNEVIDRFQATSG